MPLNLAYALVVDNQVRNSYGSDSSSVVVFVGGIVLLVGVFMMFAFVHEKFEKAFPSNNHPKTFSLLITVGIVFLLRDILGLWSNFVFFAIGGWSIYKMFKKS